MGGGGDIYENILQFGMRNAYHLWFYVLQLNTKQNDNIAMRDGCCELDCEPRGIMKTTAKYIFQDAGHNITNTTVILMRLVSLQSKS